MRHAIACAGRTRVALAARALVAAASVFGAVDVSALHASPPEGRFRHPTSPAPAVADGAIPGGEYVIADGGTTATERNVHRFDAPFSLRPGQFVLSGGPKPTDRIEVDDDLEIRVGDKLVFVDDDHVSTKDNRSGVGRRYAGTPILLQMAPDQTIRIRAIDHCATEAALGTLYLHGADGLRPLSAKPILRASAASLPHTFFDEAFQPAKLLVTKTPTSRSTASALPEDIGNLRSGSSARSPSYADLMARLERIERELAAIRQELGNLKSQDRSQAAR
jgi:hypothetical protein